MLILIVKNKRLALKIPVCYHAKHFPGSGTTLVTENLNYQVRKNIFS